MKKAISLCSLLSESEGSCYYGGIVTVVKNGGEKK